jgi:putative ABC transport system permease protein
MPLISVRIPLAWLQLKRERLRFLVGVAGVAFAVTLIFMQLGFHHALFASAVRFHEHLVADLVLISPQSEFLARMQPFARRRLYQTLGFEGVASVSPVYTDVAVWKNPLGPGARAVFIAGFDPAERVFDMADVERARDALRAPDVVLFDAAARPEYGPIAERTRAGTPVAAEVKNRRVSVAGLFSLGTSFGIDGTLLTSDLNFLRLFPQRQRGLINIGLIRLTSGADPEAVRRTLAAALPRDVEVLTKRDYMAREQAYWGETTPIGYVFTFGAIMGFVVGAIIVYQILFADISGHLGEYATLKAMGYRNAYLFSVVFQEAVILAVVGYVPALLVCLGLYHLTENATRLPMTLQTPTALMVLVLTIVMCCGSGAIALRKIRTADPAEVF